MPEYLVFIMLNSINGIPLKQAISQAAKVGLPHYPANFQLRFFNAKLFRLLEAIVASNFTTTVWRAEWLRDNCYVVKQNNELEYYTVYDYRSLINNLFDWLTLSSIKYSENNKDYYRLYLKLI